MDASHDQNFVCKILKIWCKTCVFCCSRYPIPVCILFLFLILYFLFPSVFTFLIYSSPIVGLSFLAHRIFLGIDRQKIKRVEEVDDKRKKFAKSRRSFKSNRSHLIRRNTNKRSDDDTDVEDKDDIFSKSLKDLLTEKKRKQKQAIDVDSVVGRGDRSSSYYSQSSRPKVYDNVNGNHKDELEGENLEVSEEEEDERQYKPVRWTEYDQKNVMDLGLSEVERNKRLENLIVRRRSRKNLGYQEKVVTENSKKVQISAIKTTKINPFLEDNSCGKKSPGSAPSSLVTTHNPFDIPYDPNEEKLDLTGDNFDDVFTVGNQKEPIYCRHQSFSLGAFSHPESTRDKHDVSFYKDLSTKQKSVIGSDSSKVDNIDSNHPKEDGTERKTQDVRHDGSNAEEDCGPSTMLEERKADIAFFYGGNKRVGRHAPSISMVSDMQVEVSEEGSAPMLDDVEIEKDRESWLNSSNQSHDTENEARSLNSDTVESDQIHESSGDSQSSVIQNAPNGLTEVAIGQAQVTSSSPKSVLQREMSD